MKRKPTDRAPNILLIHPLCTATALIMHCLCTADVPAHMHVHAQRYTARQTAHQQGFCKSEAMRLATKLMALTYVWRTNEALHHHGRIPCQAGMPAWGCMTGGIGPARTEDCAVHIDYQYNDMGWRTAP